MPLNELLVTTDLSEASERALSAAAELARETGASVRVLTVLDFDAQLPPGVLSLDPSKEKALKAEVHARVEEKLGELIDKHLSGVETSRAVEEDSGAAESICRHAEKNPPDLLIIATHGRTGVKRFLLGSVAEKVVRSAPCPVMTIPPAD